MKLVEKHFFCLKEIGFTSSPLDNAQEVWPDIFVSRPIGACLKSFSHEAPQQSHVAAT